MEKKRCDKCVRLHHNKEYHPSMRTLYMRTITGKQDSKKQSMIPVGWICSNCGNMVGIR